MSSESILSQNIQIFYKFEFKILKSELQKCFQNAWNLKKNFFLHSEFSSLLKQRKKNTAYEFCGLKRKNHENFYAFLLKLD